MSLKMQAAWCLFIKLEAKWKWITYCAGEYPCVIKQLDVRHNSGSGWFLGEKKKRICRAEEEDGHPNKCKNKNKTFYVLKREFIDFIYIISK